MYLSFPAPRWKCATRSSLRPRGSAGYRGLRREMKGSRIWTITTVAQQRLGKERRRRRTRLGNVAAAAIVVVAAAAFVFAIVTKAAPVVAVA